MNNIKAFIIKAHPSEDNSRYFPWTIAELCLLVKDFYDIETVKEILKDKQWIPISRIEPHSIIPKQVEKDQYMIDACQEALKSGFFLDVFIDTWCGFKDSPPVFAPRITEDFIDKVVERAGGERFIYEVESGDKKRNADYLIEDYIIELKIIEEERLFHNSVKTKIADLLKDNISNEVRISPDSLDYEKYLIYRNIFRPQIQEVVKSASTQVKSTKKILSEPNRKGGILIVNNGTSSFTPKLFNECVELSLANNTKTIETHLSICAWSETKGLDTTFNYLIEPKSGMISVQKKLCDSFNSVMADFMTDWARKGFQPPDKIMNPQQPISFEKYGIVFTKFDEYKTINN